MAEKKKLTEAEAKQAYAEAKAKHEQELDKQRAVELEFTLACEDYSRAGERHRNARGAKESSESNVYHAADKATKAFIELGRIQIETRGGTGR